MQQLDIFHTHPAQTYPDDDYQPVELFEAKDVFQGVNEDYCNVQNLYSTPQHINAKKAPLNYANTQSSFHNQQSHRDINLYSTNQKLNFQALIDWINSFNDPYCILVNSFDDLKDGIVFCHLVALIVCSEVDQQKLYHLVNYNINSDKKLMIQNLDLALNVLKSSNIPIPDQIENMSPQDLLINDECVYSLLETLKQTNDLLNSSSQNLKQDDDPYQVRESIQPYYRPSSISSYVAKLPQQVVAQDLSMAHSRRISDHQSFLNMPLQYNQTQDSQQKQQKSFEIQGISPINQKQGSPPKQLVSTVDPTDQFLEYQEQKLSQELNEINHSYNQIRASNPFVTVDQNENESQTQRERVSQMSQYRNSAQKNSRDRERQQIQQKQSEKKDYRKVIENSIRKMSQSKTMDSAIYERSKVTNVTPHKFNPLQNDNTSNIKMVNHSTNKLRQQEQNLVNQIQKSEEDEVMGEMQTLQIQPEQKEISNTSRMEEQITISEVDQKSKLKLLDWLIHEVKLIKNQNNSDKLLNDLPHYCKNGVFFSDLINRLNGKHQILKGVDRNPKNLTSIIQNFTKILEYFRTFPRFNPRYLWAQHYFIDTKNQDLIWGFLDDIWHWHFNKISSFDPTNKIKDKSPSKPPRNSSLYKTTQSNENAQLPPKSHRSVMEHQTHNTNLPLSTISNTSKLEKSKEFDSTPHHTRHTIGSITNKKPEVLTNNESLTRDRSYGVIHSGCQQLRTPNARNSVNGDLPLTQNSKSLYSHRYSNSKNKSANKSKKYDLTYSNTPIARDKQGNTYFQENNLKSQHQTISVYSNTNQKVINPYENIEINDEVEIEIKNWLFKIKFQHFFAREFGHQDIVNDPIRNGVFLAEIFCFLERIDMYDIILYPQTIAECKENLVKTLSLIRQRRRDIPQKYLSENIIEKLLKRDKQVLYSLLYIFKLTYAETTMAPKDVSLMTAFETAGTKQYLPYSIEDQRMLESSLINWIKSMGIFHRLGKQNADSIDSMIEIQQDISNGNILCELVSIIFNVKLPGIFRDPKTETTCISNIRKALEILRKQRKMSQKFTWAEKEIYEGKIQVAMGLLEDIHRCFDGLQPRKRGPNYFSDGPYLGDTLYSAQPFLKYKCENIFSSKKQSNSLSLEQPKSNEKSKFRTDQGISTQEKTFDLGGPNTERRFEDIPSLYNQGNRDFLTCQTNSTQDQLRQLIGSPTSNQTPSVTLQVGSKPTFAQFLNKRLQNESEKCRSPLKPSEIKIEKQNLPKIYIETDSNKENKSHKFNLKYQVPSINEGFLTKNDITDKYPQPPQKSPISAYSPNRKSYEFDGKDKLKKPVQFSVEDYENEEHEANRSIFNGKEKQKIIEWLQLIKVKLPPTFDLDREELSEFKDGVLLCQIIGILEMSKVDNIQPQPKSKAACLQNIKKGLAVLKKKNQIPLYLIYSDEEIYKGNAEIIFQLLKSLRQVYKTKTQTLMDNQKRENSKSITRGSLKRSDKPIGEFGTLTSDFKDPKDRKDGWPLPPKDRKHLLDI